MSREGAPRSLRPYDMGSDPVKILYIAGWTRSGSTILDRVFGHVDGYFSLGEFRYVWDRGLLENRLCGSGKPFLKDTLWKKIFKEAFGGMDPELGRRMTWYRDRLIPKRAVGYMMAPGDGLRPTGYDYFRENLAKVYRAIAKVTGANVIVDSGKSPTYGHLLATLPGFDVRTLHLIRDPRAVSQSWLKAKPLVDGKPGEAMAVLHPADNAFHWSYWNGVTELLAWRRQGTIRRQLYENFMQRPRKSVEEIVEFMGTPGAKAPFVSDSEIKLGPDHTVAGNPDRLKHGVIELKADERWRDDLPQSARHWTEAIFWPLMMRYGYEL